MTKCMIECITLMINFAIEKYNGFTLVLINRVRAHLAGLWFALECDRSFRSG